MHEDSHRRIAVLFLQAHCNMTCSFCATENRVETLSMEKAQSFLRLLRKRGLHEIILGGGEPLTWKPGAMALAGFAKSLGFHVQIGTNGIALDSSQARSPAVDRFILPLESVSAQVHDALRRFRTGHHALVLRRLDELGRVGKPITLSTVVTQSNADALAELARWIEDYHARFGNVHAWHLYRFLPVGRGGGPNASRLATDYQRACAALQGRNPGFRILRRPDMQHSRCVGFFWREGARWLGQSPYPLMLPTETAPADG